MIQDIPRLIDVARTWTASECASSPVGAHQTIDYLATALDAEHKRAESLLADLDARFEHSDHTAAKYYRRMREAEQEGDRAKSGAHTLGQIVERQVEDTLRWAGMEDQIGTNDPDQQLAWELCAEMPGKITELTAERDRYRAAIDEEMKRHTEKHGETARYEADDFDHERPPAHWEPYVICNACGTDYPCRTRQTLTRALNENGETDDQS